MDYYEIKNREYNFPVSGVQTEEWCEMESRERERERERERKRERERAIRTGTFVTKKGHFCNGIGNFCNQGRELL